jgi:hypothetical protein
MDIVCIYKHVSTHELAKVLGGTRSVETNRISVNGNPILCTFVVVPGRLPRAIPVSAIPKSIHYRK